MDTLVLALLFFFFLGVFPLAALITALVALSRCRTLEIQVAEWKDRTFQPQETGSPPPRTPEMEKIPGVWSLEDSGTRPARPVTLEVFQKAPQEIPQPEPERPPLPAENPEAPWSAEIGLEERLGTRLPVWIGSVALFLAGAFLVKLSFDRGWLGPLTRVVLGGVFGLALLSLGEILVRRLERIAQGLSGAGIAVLYASLLAAVSLYGFIPRGLGFFLLAVITAVAVLLSLRQGPWIAVLGLVGGFTTPLLIGSEEPDAKIMFIYLFALQTGVLALIRRRNWWPLSWLTLTGCAAWTLGWTLLNPEDSVALALFIVASVGVTAWAGSLSGSQTSESREGAGHLVLAGAGTNLVLLGVLVQAAHFGVFEWLFFGLLAAGCLSLARIRPDVCLLPWLATIIGFVLFSVWRTPQGLIPGGFSITLLAFGALMVLGSYLAAFGSAREKEWALLGCISAGLFFLAGWSVFDFPQETRFWGWWSLGLAVLHAVLAIPFALWRAKNEQHEQAFARFAVAAAVFAAVAVPLEFKEFWWTGLWAIGVPALVYFAGLLRLDCLRRVAAGQSALVLFRLLVHPILFEYPAHGGPLANSFIPGFGVPLMALVLAAWLLRRNGETTGHYLHEIGAAVLAALFGIYQIRLAYHPAGAYTRHSWNLATDPLFPAECGTILVFLLALTWILWEGHRVWPRKSLEGGAILSFGLALCTAFVNVAANPLWTGQAVGAAFLLNGLIPAYGLPALGLGLLSRRLSLKQEASAAALAGAASLVFWFHFFSLEIRQAFHGSVLSAGDTIPAELYSYSAAWVVFGVALLALGTLLENTPLRWASLGVMFLSVSKVFLIDLAELRDFLRVLSLLGLGASLMVLAFVYQRFVFRNRGTRTP